MNNQICNIIKRNFTIFYKENFKFFCSFILYLLFLYFLNIYQPFSSNEFVKIFNGLYCINEFNIILLISNLMLWILIVYMHIKCFEFNLDLGSEYIFERISKSDWKFAQLIFIIINELLISFMMILFYLLLYGRPFTAYYQNIFIIVFFLRLLATILNIIFVEKLKKIGIFISFVDLLLLTEISNIFNFNIIFIIGLIILTILIIIIYFFLDYSDGGGIYD